MSELFQPLQGPPVNMEAEQAFLSALLSNNRALDLCPDLLPDHFADGAHQRIFRACQGLIQRGASANAVTLKNYFDRDQGLIEVGGAAYLAQVQAASVGIVNVADYASLIRDLFIRRQLMEIAIDLQAKAQSPDLDTTGAALIAEANAALFDLAERGRNQRDTTTFAEAADEVLTQIEARQKAGGGLLGLSTGFSSLDRWTGGLEAGAMMVLAARASMGKTSLALSLAERVAAQGGRVLFFSLEQSNSQVLRRAMASRTGMKFQHLSGSGLSTAEFDHLFEVGRELGELPIILDDNAGHTPMSVLTQARRVKQGKGGLDLIIIDYLGFLRPNRGERHDRKSSEIGAIVRGIKEAAKTLQVPIILLSQLNRKADEREDHRPLLSDLRESGDIEQDADIVALLFREHYYLKRAEPRSPRQRETEDQFQDRYQQWEQNFEKSRGKAELILAKQRNGQTGTIPMRFDEQRMQFSDYHEDQARQEEIPL